MRQQSTAAAFVWIVALAGWMSLWAFTNPEGAAPDEPSHYAKAVAAGQGDLRGNPVPVEIIRSFGVFNEDAIKQVRNSYRSFLLATDVARTTAPPCTAFRVDLDGGCLSEPVGFAGASRVESIVGAYPPWLYLPGGIASRFADSVHAAYLLARLSSVAICAGLLAAASWLLVAGRRRQTPVLLAGLALGCPPMTIFLSSSTGASGPEAVGALASAAAALRLSARELPSRATWLVAGGVLAVTAASRPFAPLWVALAVAVGLSRLGWRGSGRRLRAGGGSAMTAVAAVLVGAAGSMVWTQSMALRMPLSLDRIDEGLAHAVDIAPVMAGQAVGVFGWQELPLPAAVRLAWAAMVLAAVVAAVVRGRRRDAAVTVAALVATTAVYLLLAGTVFYQNGLGMQGRYILPALAIVPVVAAATIADPRPPRPSRQLRQPGREVAPRPARRGTPAFLYRDTPVRSGRTLTPRLAGIVMALFGVAQAVAWGLNARRYAVGVDGPVWFPAAADPAWSPLGGWSLWVGLACLLILLTIASGVLAANSAQAARFAPDAILAPSSGADPDASRAVGPGAEPDADPKEPAGAATVAGTAGGEVDAARPGTPLRMPAVVSTGTPAGVPGRPPDPRSAPPGAQTSRRRRPRWTPIPLPPRQPVGGTAVREAPDDRVTPVPFQPAVTDDPAGDLTGDLTGDYTADPAEDRAGSAADDGR